MHRRLAGFEIRTDGLVKSFGRAHVVDGVSLHFRAGESSACSPNARQATTFYMIVGLIPASAGS